MVITFGGSRSLPPSPVLSAVVRAAAAAGASVQVGCAAGADSQVILAVLAAGAAHQLTVHAVGAASGAGFWGGSALASVRAAAAAGASVHWLAGGSLSVPLRARLILRSKAALVGAACFVVFLASPASPGSLAVAGAAAQAGVPVSAFCAAQPCPPRGCSGAWQPGQFLGFSCWSWVPAASQLSLF